VANKEIPKNRKGTAASCELKLITCKSGSSSRSHSSLSSEALKKAEEAFKNYMIRSVRESLQMATNPDFFGPKLQEACLKEELQSERKRK
jgi:hypothetical protein